MSTTDLVRIPRLTTRSSNIWFALVCTGIVAALVAHAVLVREDLVIALVAWPLCALGAVVALWFATWIDPAEGVLVRVRCGWYRRRVPLGPDTRVDLVPNTVNGTVLLGVRPPGARRRLYFALLAIDDSVARSLDPGVLRILADAFERHHVTVSPRLGRLLRAQADHSDAGGSPRTSPLATLVPTRRGSR